ncbi:unnamed protein product [Rhizophagus irregularis]|nr:unnamed protein product [Rhizophagus irregularis]
MNDYFKKQTPSSFSFLNFLCFKLLYENERPSWKSKKEEFELYCRDLNLYLRDQVVNEDLREKWSELIESQEEKDSQEVQTLWKQYRRNNLLLLHG